MKKTRLLTPILLATTSCSLLPITSCNNTFDGKVTEQEWKDAIGFLCGNSEEPMYWSIKDGDYIAIHTKSTINEDLLYCTSWVTNPNGTCVTASDTSWSGPIQKYERFIGNFCYSFVSQTQSSVEAYDIDDDGSFSIVLLFFSSIYNYYNNFELKDDKCYHYVGSSEVFTSVNTKIGFSKDKKISNLETTTVMKQGDTTITLSIKINLDYSKKEIQWPSNVTERMSKHCFKLSDTTKFDTSIYQTQDEGFVIEVFPKNDGYTKLSAYDGGTAKDMFSDTLVIYKNNEKLVQDAEKGYTVNSGVIEFKDSLQSTDSIYIKFQPANSLYGEYEFKLE